MKNYVVATGLLASSCLAAMQAHGVENAGAVKDARIDGKLGVVYALDRHLSVTAAAQSMVRLTGQVRSDIDRDLAGEFAKGIDGFIEADNDFLLAARAADAAMAASAADSSFAAWIEDETTTARVRTRLSNNPNTDGLRIEIATRDDVVTLSGEVGWAEQSALAEELARNTGDVKDVRNQLMVKKAL